MKLKHVLIPYAVLLVVLPALIAHLSVPLKIDRVFWESFLDILMAAVAAVGLIAVLIRRKKHFRGWIPLLFLTLLVLAPQAWLWRTQHRGFPQLRQIYRFALLYITLFILPLEIHYTKRELYILIGALCLFGLFCCGWEIRQHPKVWEAMRFFSGGKSDVQSFFGQRNRFGAYTALWMILCLFAFQLSGSLLWLIPGAFFGCFLVMTESRGALLLAGVFIFCSFLSYRKRIGTRNTLAILLDLAIIGILLWMIPPVRHFLTRLIDLDRGVTGRDRIWQISWEYFREANPLFGHGLGAPIEQVMIERLGAGISTHNAYFYILNSGGICLVLFYILSFAFLMGYHCRRKHYLIPLVIAVMAYAFFEMACTPFDYWHLSNMFTICIFCLPAASAFRRSSRTIPIH